MEDIIDKVLKSICYIFTSIACLGMSVAIYAGTDFSNAKGYDIALWALFEGAIIFIGLHFFIKFEKFVTDNVENPK